MKLFFSLLVPLLCSSPALCTSTPEALYWQLQHLERYVYPADESVLNWQDIRKQRRQRKKAHNAPKKITLTNSGQQTPDFPAVITASVLDPNGHITTYQGRSITLPENTNLIGRYLVASQVQWGVINREEGNKTTPVVYCSKAIIPHHKNGGSVGTSSVVFWDDPQRLPLEIGPVLNTAKSRFGGSLQMTHREYEMMVRYHTRPLAGATVTVSSLDSGWSQTRTTDERGIFLVMPTDDRLNKKDYQTYLYSSQHYDAENNITYVATFPVTIYKNRPEWQAKAMGFMYWAIAGTGLTTLILIGYGRKRRHEEQSQLVVFEHQSIRKG